MELAKRDGDLGTTPLFRNLSRGGAVQPVRERLNANGGFTGFSGLTTKSVAKIIKSRCKIAGLENWNGFSGHSARRGFATTANEKGVSIADIAKAGRWDSVASVEAYIESKPSHARNKVTGDWD